MNDAVQAASGSAASHAAGLEQNINYRYFAEFVGRRAARADGPFKVLDFGCGHGYMVKVLREAGLDAYGADVFYEGTDWEGDPVLDRQRKEGIVREIPAENGVIPFQEGEFDLIVSNQVYEHVADMRAANAQLGRVLAGDGSMYHHFPSRQVVREGHIGIPMAHWMKPGKARDRYTLLLRSLGIGNHKDEAPDPRDWTRSKLDWIDTYCFYRPYAEISAILGDGYELIHHEIEYCRFRASGTRLEPLMNASALRAPIEHAFRRLAFMAIEQRRRPV